MQHVYRDHTIYLVHAAFKHENYHLGPRNEFLRDDTCIGRLVLPPRSKQQMLWTFLGSLFILWDSGGRKTSSGGDTTMFSNTKEIYFFYHKTGIHVFANKKLYFSNQNPLSFPFPGRPVKTAASAGPDHHPFGVLSAPRPSWHLHHHGPVPWPRLDGSWQPGKLERRLFEVEEVRFGMKKIPGSVSHSLNIRCFC